MTTTQQHPISDLQLDQLVIEWVPYETVRPNKYNPNKMTWHDRMLLRQSLLEDGWTQPIVTLLDSTIVDGEQRWTTAGLELPIEDIDNIINTMREREAAGAEISQSIMERLLAGRERLQEVIDSGAKPTLASITGGLVPITRVDFKDEAHRMLSTIRHNRARGSHNIDAMAGITLDLHKLGLDFDDLEVRLGMDDDEISRMLETASLPDQLDLSDGPSQAWAPVHIHELEDDELAGEEIRRSRKAAEEAKAYRMELAARQRKIAEAVEMRVEEAEAESDKALTQDDREEIKQEIEKAMPKPEEPARTELNLFKFYVTAQEYKTILDLFGEPLVDGFIRVCKEAYEAVHGAGSWAEAIESTE